jgi:hypothetical protein
MVWHLEIVHFAIEILETGSPNKHILHVYCDGSFLARRASLDFFVSMGSLKEQ